MKNNIINLAKTLENLIKERKALMQIHQESKVKNEENRKVVVQALEIGRDISKIRRMMVKEIQSERWATHTWDANEAVRVGDVIYISTASGLLLRVEINKVPKL